MRKIRNIALVFILIMAVMVFTGCTTFDNFKEAFFTDKGASADTVTIGVLEPQTGDSSENGEQEIKGIKLAHKLAGKVLGKKIELVYADTQSSIYVTESAVNDLIDKKPAVVLGAYGEAATLQASKLLGKAKIPAVAISCTNPLITENNEYYFRVSFSESSQGNALADYTYNYLKQKKAAVVRVQDDESSNDLVNRFNKKMIKYTGDSDCVDLVEIDSAAKNFKEEVQNLKLSGVKVVFLPVTLNTAEKVFKEATALGMSNVTFIGPKEWHTDELIKLQQKYKSLKIAVASDFSTNMTSSVLYDNFIKAYKEEYGDDEPAENTALAFDAYMIAVKAIEKAQSVDGDAIKDELKNITDFDGASGEISFDESGDPEKTITIDVIKNGKFVSVYKVN